MHWVDWGFQTKAHLEATNPELAQATQEKSELQWQEGLSLYSTVESWRNDRIKANHIDKNIEIIEL